MFLAPAVSDTGEPKQSQASRMPSQFTLSQEQGSTSKEQISQVFFSILSYSTEEIRKLNRWARTSTDSKSSTILRSRNRTRCIFSKSKWGCGSILAERKVPQDLLSHLYPCLYQTRPTATVFSSPKETNILFLPPPPFPEQDEWNTPGSLRSSVSTEEICKGNFFNLLK